MSSKMEKIIVAAIDLGTYYSGYAFSFKNEYEEDPTRVTINPAWNSRRASCLKQPTYVLCKPNGEFYSFGYEAEDKYTALAEDDEHQKWYFFQRFKLLLHHEQVKVGIDIIDDKGLKMPAKKVFAMAIRYLKDHLLYTLERRGLSVKVDDIHWVIPVPTTWSVSAKTFMRETAIEAGIDGGLLTIVLDSDAVTMYCQMLGSHQLLSGDKFNDTKYIVIDLGDERVNITAYDNESDGTIKVVYAISYRSMGGTKVNEEFNQMLIKIVGATVFKKFCDENKDDYMDMYREFNFRKRHSTGRYDKITIKMPIALKDIYKETSSETIEDAIDQTPYRGKLEWRGDKMRLDADLFRSLFQNTVNKITKYLADVLENPGVKGTSTFLMVGDFSGCQLMQEAMKKAFPYIKIVYPCDPDLVAVLKGAVVFGHTKRGAYDVCAALPYEIRRMDERFQNLYREALSTEAERVYNIRVMIVGHLGVGKTALTKRLLNEEVKETERESTEGIEIHDMRCEIDHETREWIARKDDMLDSNTQRIADILRKHVECTTSQVKEDSSTPRQQNVISCEDNVASKSISKIEKESKVAMGSSSSDTKNTPVQITTPRAEGENHETNLQENFGRQDRNSSSPSMNQNIDGESYGTNLEEIQKILKMERFLTLSSKAVSPVTVLDFAGQFLFYTTHQAFMSWRTIYLLVTDMQLPLTGPVEDNDGGTALSGNKIRNVQALFKSYFEAIRRNLSNSVLQYHLADEDFAVSNIGFDHNIENLKQKIFDMAQKQEYWGELIPARWFPLEQVLLERKRDGVPILDYTEVEKLNQSRQVKIDKPEELVLFLQFEHDVGNVVFFFTEKLKRKVVLDPQWLIHGVTTLITSDQVIKRYPALSAQWYDFKDTGRLTRNLIDSLWSHHAEFDDNKEHLLGLLEQLNIIAKPLMKTTDTEKDYYWVPCMVHTTAPENIKILGEREGMTKTSTLCFESKTKFIHVGVFHRLLATCLSKWMPVKDGDKYLVFIGLCLLQLDNCHNLMLSLNDFVIQATVMRITTKGAKPDLSICIDVKEYLHSSLSEISKYICPNSEYVVCIMCSSSAPQTNGDRHEIDFLRENKGKEIRCNSQRHTHSSSEELLGSWEKCLEREGKSGGCEVPFKSSGVGLKLYGYLTTERYLDYVAGKLGMEWQSMARQLELSQAEIQQIQSNYPGNTRCQIFTALTKWAHRSQKDDRGKVRELVDALKEVQRNDLANELERNLSDVAKSSPERNTGASNKPVSKMCILS